MGVLFCQMGRLAASRWDQGLRDWEGKLCSDLVMYWVLDNLRTETFLYLKFNIFVKTESNLTNKFNSGFG